MPVSGNDDVTGVKPFSWKYSDYTAGVPIKKRRFPMMRPPSPPPEEPSLPPAKTEQSSQLEGSTISYASVATSSQVSDATKVPESEPIKEKVPESDDTSGSSVVQNGNMVKGIDSVVRVKVEQPSGRVQLSPSEELQSKGKFVMTDNLAPQMTLGRNMLSLRPTESAVSSLNRDIMHGKHLAVVKREEVMPATGESTGLSLSSKENHSPALTSQKSDTRLSHLSRNSSEPVSLSLSLTEEKTSSQSKPDAEDLKTDGAQMQSSRANCDLNTPIDAWEDSFNDTPVSVNQINAKGGAHYLSTIGRTEGGVSSERRIISENHKRTDLSVLSKLGSQQCKSTGPLILRLGSNSLPNLSQRPSSSIGLNFPSRDSANMPRVAAPTSNLNLGNHRMVKAEPFDGSVKQEPNSIVPLNIRAVKHGVVERFIVGAINSSNENTKQFVDPISIKPEPASEFSQDMSNSTKGKSFQLYKHLMNGLDGHSSVMKLPVTAGISTPAGKPSCLIELTGQPSSSELTVTNHSGESSGKLFHEACQSNEKFAMSLGHDNKVFNFQNKDDKEVDSPSSKLKLMNVEPLGSRGSGGTSDEGKLNISTDVSYGTDYESDANHIIKTAVQIKREGKEDCEDGDISNSRLGAAVQDEFMREERPVENADLKNERTVCAGPVDIVHRTSYHVEAKEIKIDNLAGTSKESCDLGINSKSDKGCDNDTCMQEPSFTEKVTSSEALKGSISTVTTEPLNDEFEVKDSRMYQDVELSSEQMTLGNPETALSTALITEMNGTTTEPVQRSESTLSKTFGSADNGTKDRGQRSRIITLPRSLNGYPSRSLSIPGQSIPSRGGTDMLPDATADDEELLPGRGETYADDMYRFPRECYQDQSWRSSGVNVRFRGRMSDRGSHLNSDRYLAAERHYNQTKYRIPRYKYINDVSDPDLEYNNVSMASDDASFGGRGGSKFSNDGQINHRIPSRSPIGEQIVHVSHGNQRNFSPGRCDDEETSGLVGTRHNEKFMRVFPDDSVDPMFNHAQNSYDGNSQFGRGRGRWRGRGRGNRDYYFIERRGFRDRSKSPIRTRTRSPESWLSPRGRSSYGFGGRGEHGPHYRMQRFRSPDEASFTREMVVRRDLPNDLRDMDTGRGRGNQRWGSQRSSSGVVFRNRRFDVTNPRERAENNEYFVGGGGPVHSSRVHELGGDGNGDERRRFGERRGPVRTFRPPYNTADEETFQDNTEDGPRPFGFCQDGETEFQERGSLRDRYTDRRIKNRPGNAPKRIRSIEDQEGNFTNDGQQWNNVAFDDISQAKRKMF